LCGPLDENLKQIASALEIEIARRGAHFKLTGDKDNTRIAAQLLESFYARSKEAIELEDIQLSLVAANKLSADTVTTAAMPNLMTRRADLHGRTPRQVSYLQQVQDYDITFGIGPAGTGKTYLAVACAVDALTRDKVKKIVLVRPAVEAGERLGFLPGDLSQKVDPYLRPLYDALYDLGGYDSVNKMFERGAIEVAPLAYMRGRTLNQSFIILDEAQNTTPEQMKMFLTRIGEDCITVVNGDVAQCDLDRDSGLRVALKLIRDRQIPVPVVEFSVDDIVRSGLCAMWVRAFEGAPMKGY
jgi:phosphate starvation-inducible PhoH-like protein